MPLVCSLAALTLTDQQYYREMISSFKEKKYASVCLHLANLSLIPDHYICILEHLLE